MKKLTFGLIVALLCAVCTAALCGCADGGAFTAGNKSFDSVKNIDVSVRDREIEITASDDETVHIEYFENDKEYYKIKADENGNLIIKLVSDKKWTDFISVKPDVQYRKLIIKIPAGLGILKVDTTNETVSLSSVATANAILSNNGGDVSFDKLSVDESLDVTVKNGNITGSVTGGWDDFSIISDSKKGKNNLPAEKTGGSKTLKASCNNGDIKVDFLKES